jgi:23S rRNA pseudouridine2605 synthase
MRINQYIARNTGLSRRMVDTLIQKQLVRVNGEYVSLGHDITNQTVELCESGVWRSIQTQCSTNKNLAHIVLMYKPIFCITTRSDEFKRKTIYDILPRTFASYKSAGRLDYMSEGLLVLSTNGGIIHELTHPRHETPKMYLVGLQSPLSSKHIDLMRGGMELEGYSLNPVVVTSYIDHSFDYLKPEKHLHWYTFTLTEGRNNQIRKMVALYGNKVQRLIRIANGQYTLSHELYTKRYMEI